jgi:site-specific DNA-adenine methylase
MFAGALNVYANVPLPKANSVLLNDINLRAINCFDCAMKFPDELLIRIKYYLQKSNKNADRYNEIRREFNLSGWTGIENAARYIYILMNCFNHSERISKGQNNRGIPRFNNSFSSRTLNYEFREDEYWYLVNKMNNEHVQFYCMDYKDFIPYIPNKSFSYCDSPFQYEGTYSLRWAETFKDEHVELRKHIEEMKRRGITIVMSNFDNPLVRMTYGLTGKNPIGKVLASFPSYSSSRRINRSSKYELIGMY